MEVLHFFKFILVLVHLLAYYSVYKFYTQLLLYYFVQIYLLYYTVFILINFLKYSLNLSQPSEM